MRIKGSVFSVLPVVDGALTPTQAFSELRLGAVIARFVVDPAGHLGRTVVLFHPAAGVVVGVLVSLTVAELLRPAVMRVTQMRWERRREGRPGHRPGPVPMLG